MKNFSKKPLNNFLQKTSVIARAIARGNLNLRDKSLIGIAALRSQ